MGLAARRWGFSALAKGVNHPAYSLFGNGLVLAYTESGGEDWIQHPGCWAKAVSARTGKVAVLASSCSRPMPFPKSVDMAGKDGVLALYQGNGPPVRLRGIGQRHSSGWDVALSPLGAAIVTGNENIQADSSGYRTDLSVFSLMPCARCARQCQAAGSIGGMGDVLRESAESRPAFRVL